ncbi:hypothetical protein BGZ73_004351 [Actinomortierella ambigua]|nr:hypothetical protein BGZ73_004351 [Actinomortierella ambigua]
MLSDAQLCAAPLESLQKYGVYTWSVELTLGDDEEDNDGNDIFGHDAQGIAHGKTTGDTQDRVNNAQFVRRARFLTCIQNLDLKFQSSEMPFRTLRALLTDHHHTLECITLYNYGDFSPLPLLGAALPQPITFPKLAYLELQRWYISDNDMDEIIRRCPVLHTLTLDQIICNPVNLSMANPHEDDDDDYAYDDSEEEGDGDVDISISSLNLSEQPKIVHPTVEVVEFNDTSLDFVHRFPRLELLKLNACQPFDGSRLGRELRHHCPRLRRIHWDRFWMSSQPLTTRQHPEEWVGPNGVEHLTEFSWHTHQWRNSKVIGIAVVEALRTWHSATLERVEIVCDHLYVSALPFLEECPRLRSLIVVTNIFAKETAACFQHDLVGTDREDGYEDEVKDKDQQNPRGVMDSSPKTHPSSPKTQKPWVCNKTLCTLALGFTNITSHNVVHPVMTALGFSTSSMVSPSRLQATTTTLLVSRGLSSLSQRRLFRRLYVMENLRFVNLINVWYVRRKSPLDI